MSSLKLALILTLTLVFTIISAVANQAVATEASLGENLLIQLWENMKKPDIEAIENTMADGFQSVHQYGANNRAQQIELIKGLKLGKYDLSNIQITRNGPVIVATYFISVAETIKGKRLLKTPAPRLSLFLKTDSGWKWMAHANLKPLE